LLHLHLYLVFPALRRSRSSASPSPMVCRRLITSVKSSLTARRFYALIVLRIHRICYSACRSSSGRSSLPSYSLRAVLGGWGFTKATDQQRVNAFFRRSICCGYSPPDLPPFEELCLAADQLLSSNILTNSGYLLHRFLPPPTAASQNYNLRIRPHNRQLTLHSGHLTDSNFLLTCYMQTYTIL